MLQSAVDHHRAGRLPQAERLYRAILAEQPQNPDALHLLGVLANQTGHPKEAAELIQRAIAQKPNAEFYFNLAGALNPAGQRDRAIDAMRQAISLNPKWIDAYANLGVMLHQSGQLDAAIAAFRQAIALHPQKFELYFNLGNALADSQQYDAALDAYATALRLNPKSYDTLINRGNTLRLLGRLEEALADFQQAESLNPTSPVPGSAYLFALQFHSDDADLILSEHKKWNTQHAAAFTHSPGTPGESGGGGVERTQNAEGRTLKDPHRTPPQFDSAHCGPEYKGRELALTSSSAFTVQRSAFPNRRLRIGYVSPEFRAHCQSLFTTALLPQHDHEQFEIFCYSCIPMPDDTTDFLKQHADVWRPITNVPDPTVAEQIRNDKIDVLVDLTMHMANSRLLLFARKPAFIQACWLAYPGTTGLSTMDYRLTDPYLDPPGF
ncbi:MAG TPA: tetratricopeptide repeat protein, partial [Tepidisphaeraceae bacterium]